MEHDHDFARQEDEERYGIPRVWRHQDAPDHVRCWVQKNRHGRWEVHHRLQVPADELERHTASPPFEDRDTAIEHAEEWMQDYSEKRRRNLDAAS